jgi:large subunit ribosomal protein L30
MAKKKKKSVSKLKVTLVKSVNRRTKQHKSCVSGLGLRRIGHSVIVNDTPEIRGMINKAYYLLAVEEEA